MLNLQIEFEAQANKDLEKLPFALKQKVFMFLSHLKCHGLLGSQKYPAFHDKALQGKRFGQRSIRLNRAYRLFYRILKIDRKIIVLEINKHEY